jgi:hypothetical protein
MKKILLLLIITLIGFAGFSQTYTNYSIAAIDTTSTLIPRYLIGENVNTNTKDTLGIIITIKQAQKINTDLDILYLYRGLHKECDSTVNFLVQVVDDYKKANILAEASIKACDSTLNTRNLQIENLKEQISISAARLLAKDSTISAKDDMIKLTKQESKKFKKQRNKTILVACGLGAIILAILAGHI